MAKKTKKSKGGKVSQVNVPEQTSYFEEMDACGLTKREVFKLEDRHENRIRLAEKLLGAYNGPPLHALGPVDRSAVSCNIAFIAEQTEKCLYLMHELARQEAIAVARNQKGAR